ncbi:hypothetical protein A5789_00030 [Nocardia sp. 852002-51101_SCH5132738]|nr:hypothetical protein A5789_00030 [Nocardia sp. 852002-51101_SCH5132738]OBB46874.1 hypothetical protein A5748_24200 [Nocardia sp. 852002-51244_SCH5132740]OBF86059.1 hypothetical protein A9X06_13035 [Mycobacterium sp. 852002-51759_SCH5129042]
MPSGGMRSGAVVVVCQVRGVVAEVARQLAQVTQHVEWLVDAFIVRLAAGLARRARRQLYGQLGRPESQHRWVARR